MEKIIKNNEEHSEGLKPYKANPKYHALTMRIHRLRKKIDKTLNTIQRSELLKNFRSLNIERRRMKSILPNPNFVKLKYVRYADD